MTTPSRLVITLAEPGSDEARRLMTDLVTELLTLYGDAEWQGDLVPEGCTPPGGAFVVARRDGAPIACGGFRAFGPGVAELKRVYVEPAERGVGVARALVTHLEELAVACGYLAMRLEAGTQQPDALRLYERVGYRSISPGWGPYAGDPSSVFLEKSLAREGEHG